MMNLSYKIFAATVAILAIIFTLVLYYKKDYPDWVISTSVTLYIALLVCIVIGIKYGG